MCVLSNPAPYYSDYVLLQKYTDKLYLSAALNIEFVPIAPLKRR